MLLQNEKQKNIVFFLSFPGQGGVGKTTAIKHLALSWAEKNSPELNKFHFVFHIALKLVKDNCPIEDIIIAQHNGLKANQIKPGEITTILNKRKCLVLVDGHDEYKTGTNSNIDGALSKEHLWNCSIILTSREKGVTKKLRDYMDAEAEILGFANKDVPVYMEKHLGDPRKAEALLSFSMWPKKQMFEKRRKKRSRNSACWQREHDKVGGVSLERTSKKPVPFFRGIYICTQKGIFVLIFLCQDEWPLVTVRVFLVSGRSCKSSRVRSPTESLEWSSVWNRSNLPPRRGTNSTFLWTCVTTRVCRCRIHCSAEKGLVFPDSISNDAIVQRPPPSPWNKYSTMELSGEG